MRMVGRIRMKELWERIPEVKASSRTWYHLVSQINWKSLTEICQTFGSVEFLRGGIANAIVAFKTGVDECRLITAIHFDPGRLFILKAGAQRIETPTGFEDLNRVFTLHLIRDDADLEESLEIADRLAVLERRTSDQEVYLESLSMLIQRYEDAHHRIDTSDLDPVETLRFLLEHQGMAPTGLGAAVLRRERPLTKSIVLKLSAYFGVSPGVFVEPGIAD